MQTGNHLQVLALWLIVGSSSATAESPVTIHRDEFGVPHIFAATDEDACYAMGYAQAEDRLEELMRQYRRATGTMSEVFGPDHLQDDYRQRVWRHAEVAREKYDELDPRVRRMLEAFQQGVRHYMREHPDDVPDWAPNMKPWMCVALARYVIWNWPEGDAAGDMKRAGIEFDPLPYRGSNQWLVGPERTAYGAPLALVDPHLGWYGAMRFYEARMYGDTLAVSGMAIVGLPLPSLGHNKYCSVAMTTGGPDAADCYVVELNPEDPNRYRYDGRWREVDVRRDVIRIKDGDTVRQEPIVLRATHHGPIVVEHQGRAYCLKIPYADEVRLAEQTYRMMTARNLAEMKQALAMLQLMEQNVMVATVDGDIFYVRNGRVPVRAPGHDYKLPVPGGTAETEWRGFHRFQDLVQLHNPPQGYMQNCNVSPQFMIKGCPLRPEDWSDRPYLFNGFHSLEQMYDNPLHQRAAMCLEVLDSATRMTVDDAIALANNTEVFGADVWQQKLSDAWAEADSEVRQQQRYARMASVIKAWDRHCSAESTAAIAYHYWKKQFGPDVTRADRAGFPPPDDITKDDIVDALQRGADALIEDFGRLEVPYGEVFRVGRRGTDKSWPVSGGSIHGIATCRAISFDPVEGTRQMLGRGGQTSTQIVLLTTPPKSWTVVPLGQSDHPESPHYDDQAEELFSKGKMKPTYFLDKQELRKHTTATKILKRHPARERRAERRAGT